MTGDPHPHDCEEYAVNLAELALGILTGRERAATLAHVDSCPRCAEELEQLARAADAVVSVAPEIEPTMGFEVRLFSRMGLEDPAALASPPASVIPMAGRARPLRWAARSPRWVMAVAAAVVALAVGLGIGWSVGPGRTGGTQADGPAGSEVARADLTAHGSQVGTVQTYGGPTPWMIVTLADSWSDGKVTCKVITDNGVTYKVGTFTAKDGYGAWGAPLRVSPQDVRKAEVVSSNGTVIATATLS
jgi:Putative zinc-finger